MIPDSGNSTGCNVAAGVVRVHIAARRIGRSPRTIRRWIQLGVLPARKVGLRRWAIFAADLEWVAERRDSAW